MTHTFPFSFWVYCILVVLSDTEFLRLKSIFSIVIKSKESYYPSFDFLSIHSAKLKHTKLHCMGLRKSKLNSDLSKDCTSL